MGSGARLASSESSTSTECTEVGVKWRLARARSEVPGDEAFGQKMKKWYHNSREFDDSV